MDRVGHFPEHAVPVNRYPVTDLKGELSYQQMAERIEQFKLSLYQPSAYVTDPKRLAELRATRSRQNFNQEDSERFLVGMMRTNFLKRLESSAHSLTLTLDRTLGKINVLLEKIDRYQNSGRRSDDGLASEVLPEEDEEDEDSEVCQ